MEKINIIKGAAADRLRDRLKYQKDKRTLEEVIAQGEKCAKCGQPIPVRQLAQDLGVPTSTYNVWRRKLGYNRMR